MNRDKRSSAVRCIADGGQPSGDDLSTVTLELTLQELLDVLADPRRREAIRVLETFRTSDYFRDYVSVTELTEGIIAGEIDLSDEHDMKTQADVHAPGRRDLYIDLQSVHAPKLDEAGLVDYCPLPRGSNLKPLSELSEVAAVLEVLETIASGTCEIDEADE